MSAATGSIRQKGMTKTKVVTLKYDPTATFTIKKASNRDDVTRADMFSKVRMIQAVGNDEMVTERDVPQGELQLATIEMCLVGWNLMDSSKRTYEVNSENILELLTAQERRELYNEILEFNPIWMGLDEGKDDSEESSEIKSENS
jgi:hypothetical protein